MKIIRNKYIPLRGWSAVNLFGVLFAREEAEVTERTLRHEYIHTLQMRETGYVGFYLWYAVEGLAKCLRHGKKGYYRIGFEQEAYLYDRYGSADYKANRRPFAWTEYVNRAVYEKGR